MSFRLLIAGINWPPETFLNRLIDGLTEAGVAVTIGCSTRPAGKQGRVEWLRTPSWEKSRHTKLAHLASMAVRARLRGAADTKLFAATVGQQRGIADKWRAWNQLLPYAGRRWDAIYLPWNSVAIALLPLFDLPSPVVVSCRGAQVSVAPHDPRRIEYGKSLRTTFEKAAAVHCVSQAILDDALKYGLDRDKAFIIRPAVDPAKFKPGARVQLRSQASFTVLTTGSLIWRKGFEWALLAIKKLADQGIPVRFSIIGDGPEQERLRYTISDLGIDDNVHLLGRLPSDEVIRSLQDADAFVLSSLSEGISNAVLEAMACAVPVVTTDCGGMREAVTDGVEGFVVPVRDAEAMAAALLRLALSPDLRQRMGQAGRQRIEREFGLPRQIELWLKLYQDVLRK